MKINHVFNKNNYKAWNVAPLNLCLLACVLAAYLCLIIYRHRLFFVVNGECVHSSKVLPKKNMTDAGWSLIGSRRMWFQTIKH